MVGTLIVCVATGECCLFMPGQIKAPEGDRQRKEFAHIFSDIPEKTIQDAVEKKILLLDVDRSFSLKDASDLKDANRSVSTTILSSTPTFKAAK